MGWRRLTTWLAAAVGIAFLGAEALLLNVRIRDFDEGVYWQSVRALTRGEPLFSSVFASQPPGFYYALAPLFALFHSVASLRLTVLMFGLLGLVATYFVGRAVAGPVAGLIALALAATSPLYFHESAIVQADGPSVAISVLAVALALFAARSSGRRETTLAAASGLALALALGIKFLGAVTVVPIAIVLLSDRRRWVLTASALGGLLLGSIVVFIPALMSPGAAFDDLVLTHVRAGQFVQQGLADNARLIFLHREVPLEALGLIGAVFAMLRRDRAIVMPLAWVGASIVAVLFYHPLFAHHVVMLSLALALTAAIGLSPHPALPRSGRVFLGPEGVEVIAVGALVLVTAAAGAYVAVGDIQLAMVPDVHDAEMTAAVRSVGRPGEFWISDNPWAVAAANRDIPGPVVDTSTQRTHAGLLTLNDLESARVRYHVRWVLEDSFRLDIVPGFRPWLNVHFHARQNLGGRAVLYEANQ